MLNTTEESVLATPVSDARDHIRGSPTAPVTIVEYGDFECPYCGGAHRVLQEVANEIGELYRLVFRHFPLSQIHPYAERAAEAAEAAGAQGSFWEMHDMLFENQNALDDASLQQYAQDLGLDTLRFITEITTGLYKARVREDFINGVRSGVNGTPSFFIDGHRFNGPVDAVSLNAAIVAENKRQQLQHAHSHKKTRR